MKREIRELIAKQASYDALSMAKLGALMGAVAPAAKGILGGLSGAFGRASTRGAATAMAQGSGPMMQKARGFMAGAGQVGGMVKKMIPQGVRNVAGSVGSFLGPSVAMEGVSRMMQPSQPQQQQQQPGY